MSIATENFRQFQAYCETLFCQDANPGAQRQAAHDLFALLSEIIGYDDNAPQAWEATDTLLPSGKAIAFQGAARCLREYRRTHKFLVGVEAAIRVAQSRFPGTRIRLMEAGCGPFAILALPMVLRFTPEQLAIVAADIHPHSLSALKTLVTGLGLEAYFEAMIHADLAEWQCPDALRPHVVVSETMLNGLRSEPQVAITRNLAPQLVPGGLFLPEAVILEFGLYRGPSSDFAVGPSFESMARFYELRAGASESPESGRIRIEAVRDAKGQAAIQTRIIVFGENELGLNDSSLTLPLFVRKLPPLAAGMELSFRYGLDPKPNWHFSVVAPATDQT